MSCRYFDRLRAVEGGRQIVTDRHAGSGRTVIEDPFSIGHGHADASVGGRFSEFIVFLRRNIIAGHI